MSNIERSIVSIVDPTIKVDKIIQADIGSNKAKEKTSEAVPQGINTPNENRWGAFMPLIVINTNRFDVDQIESMIVDFSSKIPTISVSLNDREGKFALSGIMDGDVISLYLRPPDEDNQRPIRIDFDIENHTGDPSSQFFGIRGIMKIPGIFAEKCKAFPKSTSFDHLQDVCEDIGLGFASNENSTNDSMSRICAFETYETFLNEIVDHTYKDDDSFFDWYIDPYYYLCLVNVNKQFSSEDVIEDINISNVTPLNSTAADKEAKNSFKGKLALTNQSELAGTNVFIEYWSPRNESAEIWINNGYKRFSQYFSITENNETEYVSTFVDPLTTPGAENDAILQKGRPKDNFYKQQIKYKWLGKQSSDNTHENYIFSKLLNIQNLREIGKTSIDVELGGMNFYIYKYMRIPIVIYESANRGPIRLSKLKSRDKDLGDDKNEVLLNRGLNGDTPNQRVNEIGEDARDQIKNEHVSGYYVVRSIKYTYEKPGPVKMKLNLIRREWPIPPKNNDY